MRTKKSRETIRTVCSIISATLQVIVLIIQITILIHLMGVI